VNGTARIGDSYFYAWQAALIAPAVEK